jgi:arrestin-related trafficking adapter 9
MITATLTRPTTIAPTMSCDRPIAYQEDIDIATLDKPKPRVISLEPIPRRSRTKRRATKRVKAGEQKQKEEKRTSVDSSSDNRTVHTGISSNDLEPPQSPSPSDISFSSDPSSGGAGSAFDANSVSARTAESKLGRENSAHAHSHRTQKPITASIEMAQSGFLRGDSVPIKIKVQHTKQIKSLHGIIVTFYRQARVNLQPALPRVGSSKNEEDALVPMPKTGLGLSIGSGGSSHLYRKDLSQSFASLIINPDTLSAEVKATVRVPEGAFPTISTVPGGMISFKYYVEAVLDLQGKLAGLDRFLPNAGMSGVSSHNPDGSMGLPGDTSQSVFAPWGGHFVDTEEIRRDKSVVSCTFDVVIGTKDSERKGRWRGQMPEPAEPSDASDTTEIQRFFVNDCGDGHDSHPSYPHENYNIPSIFRPPNNGHSNGYYDPLGPPPPIHTIPMPDIAAEEQHLSEKERMRLREARLLPSRPPEDGIVNSTMNGVHTPSAPPILLDDGHPPLPPLPPEAYEASAPPVDDLYAVPEDGPSAPAYHDHHPHRSSSFHMAADAATDDKQELQHRRLAMERSAPPPLSGDPPTVAGASAPPIPAALRGGDDDDDGPSAPTIEDLTLGFAQSTIHDPHLPRYER